MSISAFVANYLERKTKVTLQDGVSFGYDWLHVCVNGKELLALNASRSPEDQLRAIVRAATSRHPRFALYARDVDAGRREPDHGTEGDLDILVEALFAQPAVSVAALAALHEAERTWDDAVRTAVQSGYRVLHHH